MLLLALLNALLIAVAAQQGDPTKDVCRRHGHQTCIIDSKLYIDGGLAFWGGSVGNDSKAEPNNWLLGEDVSRAEGTEFGFPDQYKLSKGPDVPLVTGGALWPDNVNKLFYLFGGEYSDSEELKRKNAGGGFTLWLYDTIYDSWNKSKYDGSQANIRWPAFGASAVSDAGTAYYYGGYLTNASDFETEGQPVMQNALISYDMDKREWFNNTGNPTRRAEGSLHYLPASDSGLLVYFGGLETNSSSGEVIYANMSQIQLFDIASLRWYTQTATGDIPQPRRGFCAGAVWAKDKSSYNIYLFGGFGSPNGTGLGDLYVLSIPSFQWILIWPIPQQKSFPGGKGWSSCNVVRQSQMLIIGGELTNTSNPECDIPKIGGQHNMWLGQENVDYGDNGVPNWWHAPMDNVTEYRVPDQIATSIGGDTEGSATRTAPAMGWATPDLPILLARQFTTKSARTTMSGRVIPTTTATSQPTPNQTFTSKKTNVGAIAGGAVGGAVVLAGVIAGVFFCLRLKRRDQSTQERGQPSETTGTPNPHSSDMAHKSIPSASVLQGSTLAPSISQSPANSPQGPPPPTFSPWRTEGDMPDSYFQGSPSPHHQGSPPPHHMSGDWGHQGGYAQSNNYPQGAYPYQQTYYPPPPEPSRSPNKESFSHTMSVHEMPNVRSPANAAAEMAEVRSPSPKH